MSEQGASLLVCHLIQEIGYSGSVFLLPLEPLSYVTLFRVFMVQDRR